MAVVAENDKNVLLFDKRKPNQIYETLRHDSKVTAIAWSPSEPNMICSVNEGGAALIWDLYDNSHIVDESGTGVANEKAENVERTRMCWCFLASLQRRQVST